MSYLTDVLVLTADTSILFPQNPSFEPQKNMKLLSPCKPPPRFFQNTNNNNDITTCFVIYPIIDCAFKVFSLLGINVCIHLMSIAPTLIRCLLAALDIHRLASNSFWHGENPIMPNLQCLWSAIGSLGFYHVPVNSIDKGCYSITTVSAKCNYIKITWHEVKNQWYIFSKISSYD